MQCQWLDIWHHSNMLLKWYIVIVWKKVSVWGTQVDHVEKYFLNVVIGVISLLSRNFKGKLGLPLTTTTLTMGVLAILTIRHREWDIVAPYSVRSAQINVIMWFLNGYGLRFKFIEKKRHTLYKIARHT